MDNPHSNMDNPHSNMGNPHSNMGNPHLNMGDMLTESGIAVLLRFESIEVGAGRIVTDSNVRSAPPPRG